MCEFIARLGIQLAMMLALLGEIMTFVPGAKPKWFAVIAVIALVGLLSRTRRVRLISIVMAAGLAGWARWGCS